MLIRGSRLSRGSSDCRALTCLATIRNSYSRIRGTARLNVPSIDSRLSDWYRLIWRKNIVHNLGEALSRLDISVMYSEFTKNCYDLLALRTGHSKANKRCRDLSNQIPGDRSKIAIVRLKYVFKEHAYLFLNRRLWFIFVVVGRCCGCGSIIFGLL